MAFKMLPDEQTQNECMDGEILIMREKRVLLTGGSGGIGGYIKKVFEEAGNDVIAPARKEMDLSDRESIRSFIKSYGTETDIFVHCAGINLLSQIDQISMSMIDTVFQTNTFSAVEIISGIVPHMKEQKFGRIVLISSLYAIISREKRMAYSMSKNALTGLAKTLSLELGQYNILTNCVAPGYVMTDMTRKNLSIQEIEQIRESIPTKRFQSGQDIANIVMFLCSEMNQSITGQLIAVDGGFTCK